MDATGTAVVLGTKCYVEGTARDRALDGLGSMVQNDVGDLDVTVGIEVRSDGFPIVTLDGSDATAAANHLREQWGTLPPDRPDGGHHVGTLAAWTEDALILDAGREVPISAEALALGPGDPSQIRTRFGLVQHLPLEFVDDAEPRLTEDQRDQLYDWRRGAGRVNVNSATRAEVRATVNRAGHAHDIVTVERLGLLEQSIVCRDGTDPPGLLAGIGEYLPAELLCVVGD